MKIVFVCWGNICRSPMAERVAQKFAADAGLDVDITSAAVSSEELGAPIDRRAARVLTEAGYDATGHRAHRITADEIASADLVIAAEQIHIDRMRHLVPDAQNLRLINDFNPAKRAGTPLIDPWYGPESGFSETLADIEAAMPGLLAALKA
ncbi:MAG: low molecular weight protein-tyrosine-phosphatase [Propionibacteriaceae bacterium]|nr:low molecular weight protein-tyrosine-phosphatase [Propionibacteriaceae bacterium]